MPHPVCLEHLFKALGLLSAAPLPLAGSISSGKQPVWVLYFCCRGPLWTARLTTFPPPCAGHRAPRAPREAHRAGQSGSLPLASVAIISPISPDTLTVAGLTRAPSSLSNRSRRTPVPQSSSRSPRCQIVTALPSSSVSYGALLTPSLPCRASPACLLFSLPQGHGFNTGEQPSASLVTLVAS
jgi:hypothetical protein